MTYLYKTIDASSFAYAFHDYNRGDNFSYKGRLALFEYLEELAADMEQPIELDVIALCCEYSEFKDLAEFKEQYGDDIESMSDIYGLTTVLPIEGETSFIIRQF